MLSPRDAQLQDDLTIQEDLKELQQAFNAGLNSLRGCFDSNIQSLAVLFREKLENHKRYRRTLEKNRH